MKKILSIILVMVVLLSSISAFSATAGAASYVTIAKTKTFTCIPQGYKTKVAVTYKLPKINLASADAKAANKELSDLFDRVCDFDVNLLLSLRLLKTPTLKHYVYMNGSILSLLVEYNPIAGATRMYYVYNFNVKTGKKLTNEQMARGVGTTYAKATRYVNSLKGERTWSHYGNPELFYGRSNKLYAIVEWETEHGGEYTLSAVPANNRCATPQLSGIKNTKAGPLFAFKRVAGAQMYCVFRKTASTSWTKVGYVKNTQGYYLDKTAKNGIAYAYTVRCVTANGKVYESGVNTRGLAIRCKR